jgi:sec-independent protein translocase protein TatC
MTALQEIREIKNIIVSSLVFLFACTVFFFIFGIHKVPVLGYQIWMPVPDTSNSAAIQVFLRMKKDLVPDSVQLIVTSPTTGLVAQMTISFLLASILFFPYFLWRVFLYLSPALRSVERKALLLMTLPALFLFVTGAVFAYAFLIPPVLGVLYEFALPGTVVSFLDIDEFIGTVSSLLITSGLMFLLPIAMVFLNFIGAFPRDFWWRHWRGATLTILTIAAIITPDGSGTSMIILSVPLVGLYAVGASIHPKR